MDHTLYIGLDVHKETISASLAEEARNGEVRFLGNIANTPDAVARLAVKLAHHGARLDFCYEAGPCGYVIHRQLTDLGHNCIVVAPSKIARKPGDRVKTDRIDSEKLARLHRAGDLTAVWVPGEDHEAMRDLTRARVPVWDEFANSGLPLCVHMGMSFTPFQQVCESFFEAHGIGMSLPAQMAFVAIVGGGMLDRYPNIKVGFLEFGAEWVLYMVGRLGHYLPIDRDAQPNREKLPRHDIEDYLKSGRIFVAAEAEDPLLIQEMTVIGEDQILCSSDIPHSERRENSGNYTIERKDLSDQQKRKILYDNSVRLFGKP